MRSMQLRRRYRADWFLPHTFGYMLRNSRMMADAAAIISKETARDLYESLQGMVDPKDDMSIAAHVVMPAACAVTVRRASGAPATFFIKRYADLLAVEQGRAQAGGYVLSDLDLRRCAVTAWQHFVMQEQLAKDVATGFGWDLSDSWETVREVEERQHARDLVERVAKMAGRMYEVMRGVRKKVPDAHPQEVKGVTVGGDLSLVLASERAEAASGHPAMADAAAMRIMQSKALALRVAGEKPSGRGPLVVAVDESGSMSDYMSRNRNTWAKACLAALARVAHEENRMVAVVHYADTVRRRRCAPGDRSEMLEAVKHFFNGGTDTHCALVAAHEEVRMLAVEGVHGADVVLVTDGVDDKVLAMRRAIETMNKDQVRLWTVAIECDVERTHPIRELAEQYVHVDSGKLDAEATRALAAAAMGDKLR